MARRTWFPVVGLLVTVWLLFFLHSCAAPPAYRDLNSLGEIDRPPLLQIGISDFLRSDSASVAVRGPCRIGGERCEELPPGPVRLREGKIEIAGRTYEGSELRVHPEEDATLEIGTRRYHGDLLLKRDRDRLTIVNEVDLESYLKGVAGKEMSPSVHPEALKAQIIAARSYAMHEARHQTLRRVAGEKFDLYDDQRSQVYGGMERESDAICRLVDQTRGLFLLWEGRVLKAFYSSTCGGHTEPARLVMGDVERIPPLEGTRCDFCAGTKHYDWTKTFSKREIARKLFPNDPQARIQTLRISRKLPGGHAAEIGILLENRSKEILVDANRGFRLVLDPRGRELKSTLWEDPVLSGDDLAIRGHGFGHGCGMCQYGAYRMAERGQTAIQILRYYYPDVTIQKLY